MDTPMPRMAATAPSAAMTYRIVIEWSPFWFVAVGEHQAVSVACEVEWANLTVRIRGSPSSKAEA